MSVKARVEATFLEDLGFRQQLANTGMQLGTNREVVARHLVGGAPAVVRAAGPDAELDPTEAAALRKNGLISRFRSPIRDAHTRAANAVTGEVNALTKALVTLDRKKDGAAITRRIKAFEQRLRRYVNGASLSKAHPEARTELAEALKGLGRQVDRYVSVVRESAGLARAEMVEGIDDLWNGPGFWKRTGGLGYGFVFSIVATEAESRLRRMRPLSLLIEDLTAAGGTERPLDRQVREVLGGSFDEDETREIITATRAVEHKRKYEGITRHEVLHSLDRILNKYDRSLQTPHGAELIIRDYRVLLASSSDDDIRAMVDHPKEVSAGAAIAAVLLSAGLRARSSDGFEDKIDISSLYSS